MSNILDDIVAQKKKEIEKTKSTHDTDWLESKSTELKRLCFSLKSNLVSDNSTGIIAEFKRRSPSKGWFKSSDTSAKNIVHTYEHYGAAGASILTDKYYFGGEVEDLSEVRKQSNIPLLRKDFILDEIQIQEAKVYGADVILLIAAILKPDLTERLAATAKIYGMEVLLEIHEASELDHLCNDIDIVGINNRNLKTFETDITVSFDLIDKIPPGKVVISESGISDPQVIISLRKAGFKGFLIGEAFMKEPDTEEAFKRFISELNEKG